MRPPPAEARRWRRAWAVPVAALGLVVAATVLDPQVLRGLRNATFDQFQRWHPRDVAAVRADAVVPIVDIDDESLRCPGQWPWPRARITELLTAINDGRVGTSPRNPPQD